jgi:hypothetical protein
MPRISRKTIFFLAAGYAFLLGGLWAAAILMAPPMSEGLGPSGYQPRQPIDTSGYRAVFEHIPPWRADASLEEYAAAYR